MHSEVETVIFSRDRPMQLAALMASLREKVSPQIPVRILYRASTSAFERGYDLVFSMFAGLTPRREADFRGDLLSILEEISSPRMFFLVDDNLFTESVDLGAVTAGDPADTVVSLRLGRNTIAFPGGGGPTEQPRFDEHPDFPGMLAWRWGESKVGWAYSLSVDGHVFSTQEMRTLAGSIGFSAPNSFEGNLQAFSEHFARRWGICFAKSALLNIPANRVQTEWENQAGDVSVEYLLNRWLEGDAIVHRQFYGFQNTSTHMILDLPIVSRQQISMYGGF